MLLSNDRAVAAAAGARARAPTYDGHPMGKKKGGWALRECAQQHLEDAVHTTIPVYFNFWGGGYTIL